MTAYYYKEVPPYHTSGFCAVRDALDNLSNVLQLAEIINHCQYFSTEIIEKTFDLVVFSGNHRRVIIKKDDGHFSMSIPFQIVSSDDKMIAFNFDYLGEEVNGRFISIMRNAIQTVRGLPHSHEEIILSIADSFHLDVPEATKYYDAFATLIAEDHGYFRFDDDPNNINGDIHPRYHFDIFYKNTTSIKIGYDKSARIECFYSLFDSSMPKKYLTTMPLKSKLSASFK